MLLSFDSIQTEFPFPIHHSCVLIILLISSISENFIVILTGKHQQEVNYCLLNANT